MKRTLQVIALWMGVLLSAQGQFQAGGDTTICKGGQAQLWAEGGGASYFWISDPPDPSLLIPQQQYPIVSPSQSTMYICQTNEATGNLILNGTFSLGNTGFNSEYTFNPISIVAEGTYAVVSDANTVHSNFFCDEDHTTGNGLFMAVNGSGVANVQVWYLTLPSIQPWTDYEFSTWITSLHSTNPAVLQFSINGMLLSDPFQAYSSTCDWYQFFEIWNSGPNTSATISIVNQNTILSGNDFALDDISFAQVEVFHDTVWVEVIPKYTSPFTVSSATCTNEVIEVVYTGNGPDTANYQWDFDGATVVSGSGQGPYEISWASTGSKTISLIVNPEECPSPETTHSVEVTEAPEADVTADATFIPYGGTTILHGTMSGLPGPLTFSWEPEVLLADPNSLDPQTLSLEETTVFTLFVTDETTGCTGTSSIVIQVTGGPLAVNVSATPGEICTGQETQLLALVSGGTGANTFSWTSDPPGFSSDLPNPIVIPEEITTYYVQVNDGLSVVNESIVVTVHPLPEVNAGNDQTIPYGTTTALGGAASGGSGDYLFHWEPSDLLSDPDVADPSTTNLYANTEFTLVATDAETGCIGFEDKVVVNLEGGPLNVVIFGEEGICRGDTVILTASASGGDPSGYTYQWTDNYGSPYPSVASIEVHPDQSTTYLLSLSDGFNSIDDQFELEVFPSPEFQLSTSGQIVACPFDTVELTPSVQQEEWTYLWSNGSTEEMIRVGSSGIGYDIQDFWLTVTSGSGCSITEEVSVMFDFSACLGTQENPRLDQWVVYPNPISDALFIRTGNSFQGEMTILSMMGEILLCKQVSLSAGTNRIGHFDLPPGVYFLRFSSQGTQPRPIRMVVQ